MEAIKWTVKAWQTTQASAIQKCFRACGFTAETTETSDDEYPDDDIPLADLVLHFRFCWMSSHHLTQTSRLMTPSGKQTSSTAIERTPPTSPMPPIPPSTPMMRARLKRKRRKCLRDFQRDPRLCSPSAEVRT
ncbi:hypothetical protein DPMN_039185 [Dreissena polymorpha]|uniref:Uncharacterized protein n=1 Tax=Dreissena polymorpha TaxID=45954 RepID=A0A9D4MG32_DREPO|nr:hypothetical protein DPMN_039185 [Dreissena polymorpha]